MNHSAVQDHHFLTMEKVTQVKDGGRTDPLVITEQGTSTTSSCTFTPVVGEWVEVTHLDGADGSSDIAFIGYCGAGQMITQVDALINPCVPLGWTIARLGSLVLIALALMPTVDGAVTGAAQAIRSVRAARRTH